MPRNILSFLLAGISALALIPTTAQAQPVVHGPEVSVAVRAGVSQNLRDLPDATGPVAQQMRSEVHVARPSGVALADPALQPNTGSPLMPATTFNFDGMGATYPGFTNIGSPSSTNIAVGPNHVVQVVNSDIAIFDKTGTVVTAPRHLNVLWTGYVGTNPNNNCATRDDVTIDLTNVGSTDGGTGGTGSVRVGFLVGDVNASRLVAVTDLVVVNAQLGRALTGANFLSDVNTSGIITVLDKVVVNNALGHFLPAP